MIQSPGAGPARRPVRRRRPELLGFKLCCNVSYKCFTYFSYCSGSSYTAAAAYDRAGHRFCGARLIRKIRKILLPVSGGILRGLQNESLSLSLSLSLFLNLYCLLSRKAADIVFGLSTITRTTILGALERASSADVHMNQGGAPAGVLRRPPSCRRSRLAAAVADAER